MNLNYSLKSTLLRRCLAALALATGSITLASAAVSWHDVQFGGFLSQGFMISDGNNYPVDNKDGTFLFREMGVNASTNFSQNLRVGGQLFSERLGKYGQDKVVLDWAVADYNFCQEFGVRVGRVKYPRSLQSDVLDADVLRPFIFLPQAVYDNRLRDFQASFDGGMLYGTLPAGKSSFDYKVYYGDIPMYADSGVADFWNNSGLFAASGVSSLSLKSVGGATLGWNTPISGLRLAAYYSFQKNVVGSGPFSAIPTLTASIELTKHEYKGVSAEYAKDAWTFTGEYLVETGDTLFTLPSVIAPPQSGKVCYRNYYVSAARRLNDKFEVGAYYANRHNGYPKTGVASWTQKQDDFAVSGRYDLSEHMLFKLEVHYINGTNDTFNVSGVSNPPADLKQSTLLFAAKTTLSF